MPADEPMREDAGLLSWSHKGAAPLLDIALARPGVRMVANALGPAPAFMVEAAHEHEVLVAGLVGKRQHAERQRAAGVDIVVAQGYEAGGHTGEVATMVLVPEVVDAVAPTPVLAAGGIAGGRRHLFGHRPLPGLDRQARPRGTSPSPPGGSRPPRW